MTDTDTARLARSHRSLIGVNRSMTCPTTAALRGEKAEGGQNVLAIDAVTGFQGGELPVPGLPCGQLSGNDGGRMPLNAGAAILVAV